MNVTFDGYLTVAGILSGFGITVLMFRIQRELDVEEKWGPDFTWLAWADYLVIIATLLSLLLVVLPLTIFHEQTKWSVPLASASCAAASVLLAAYPFAIIDHYRIEWGKSRWGDLRKFRQGDEFHWEKLNGRGKGEPIERKIVIGAIALATLLFVGVLFR
jgi:hypothetical protein